MSGTERTWTPYQPLVEAAYQRRLKRRRVLVPLLGFLAGVPIGHQLMNGEWLAALAIVAALALLMLYQLSHTSIMHGFYADRRRAARQAGVCPGCLSPGVRHWTLAGCRKAERRG